MLHFFYIHKVDDSNKKIRITTLQNIDYDIEQTKEMIKNAEIGIIGGNYDPDKISMSIVVDPEKSIEPRIMFMSHNDSINEFHTILIDTMLFLGNRMGWEIVK